MRDYKNIDGYINRLYGSIYPQPPDEGHTALATRVINHWMGRMTTCHSVLDVGCGQGFCQYAFERQGIVYEGVALGEDVDVAERIIVTSRRWTSPFLITPMTPLI